MFNPGLRVFTPKSETPPLQLATLNKEVKSAQPSAAHQIRQNTDSLIASAIASGEEVQGHIKTILEGMNKPEDVQTKALAGRAEELTPKEATKTEFEQLSERITTLQTNLKEESDINQINEISNQILTCVAAFKLLKPQVKLEKDKQLTESLQAFRVSYKDELSSNITSIIGRIDSATGKFKDFKGHAEGLKSRALRLQAAVQQSPSIEILKSITSLEAELEATIDVQDTVNNPKQVMENFKTHRDKASVALTKFEEKLNSTHLPQSRKDLFEGDFKKQKKIIDQFSKREKLTLEEAKQFAKAVADLDKLHIELNIVIEGYDEASKFLTKTGGALKKLQATTLKNPKDKSQLEELVKKQKALIEKVELAKTPSDFKNMLEECENHQRAVSVLQRVIEIHTSEDEINSRITRLRTGGEKQTPQVSGQVDNQMSNFIAKRKTNVNAASKKGDVEAYDESVTKLRDELGAFSKDHTLLEQWFLAESNFYDALDRKTKELEEWKNYENKKVEELQMMMTSTDYTDEVKKATKKKIEAIGAQIAHTQEVIDAFKKFEKEKNQLKELHQDLDKAKNKEQLENAWNKYLNAVESFTDKHTRVDTETAKRQKELSERRIRYAKDMQRFTVEEK